MDIEILNNAVSKIENSLEFIRTELEILENQKRLEKDSLSSKSEENFKKTEAARRMRTIYALFAKGLSSWDVAEQIKENFSGNVYDAYYFITNQRCQEIARKKYARYYIIKALSDAGYSNVKISKIAGFSPQRCGQILKNGVI